MASSAISYGTSVWLADLQRSGWTLAVTERIPVRAERLTRRTLNSFREVGVLATGPLGAGVFVPCADEAEARRLLDRVEAET
jgi:hypothetical protein